MLNGSLPFVDIMCTELHNAHMTELVSLNSKWSWRINKSISCNSCWWFSVWLFKQESPPYHSSPVNNICWLSQPVFIHAFLKVGGHKMFCLLWKIDPAVCFLFCVIFKFCGFSVAVQVQSMDLFFFCCCSQKLHVFSSRQSVYCLSHTRTEPPLGSSQFKG